MLGCLLNLNRDRRNNDKLVSLFVAFFKGIVWVGVWRNNPLSSNWWVNAQYKIYLSQFLINVTEIAFYIHSKGNSDTQIETKNKHRAILFIRVAPKLWKFLKYSLAQLNYLPT